MKFYNTGVGDELVKTLRVDIFDVFSTILLILAVPLVLGIFVNLKYPRFTSKLIIPMKRFSIFAFAAMIVIIFTSNYDAFIENIKYIFVLVLIHNILAFASGYYLATAFKLTLQDRKTVSIETGIQNSGLALALLFNPMIFPADVPIGGMAFIAAWWGIWHIISGLTLASYWSGFSLKPTNVSD